MPPEAQVEILLRENKRLIADKNALYAEATRLRAEVEASAKAVEALVPLARFGLWAHDEHQSAGGLWDDEAEAVSFELGLHIGHGRDSDITIAARALLAARKDEG